MKRCPKCNRTFTHATQKFCTLDGTPLVEMPAGAGQGETVRLDSAPLQSTQISAPLPSTQIEDDEATKPISRELVSPTGELDPYKTMVNAPPDTGARILPETQGLPPSSTPPTGSGSLPASSSGPIQPPPLPPPPPPIHPVSSGPITPPISAPLTPAATTQSPAPAPSSKKSRLPLVLGILAVLLLIGIGAVGAVYWFVARPMMEARRVVV